MLTFLSGCLVGGVLGALVARWVDAKELLFLREEYDRLARLRKLRRVR